ncbi:MAG TPA: tRNA pseudouridine(55) synthase TruB [Candidatus Limiplasma sp.]|nr:tRNA pseudouridine(55) synthase TruB [Candidatus Limiplasma sp.]
MHSEADKPAYSGFLNILKPPGMTSARAVAYVRSRLNGAKVGHAGTLDPEAAGVLPLMIGKAARLFDELQNDQKAYIAEIAFGAATDTQDAQGTVVQTGTNIPTEAQLSALLPTLIGEVQQLPPMYSALKQNGRRLYDLAREGKTVERKPRTMTLFSASLLGFTSENTALIRLRCSKGFYVRTLCHDIGKKLGCPAHMRFLLRTASGIFTVDTANTLEEIDRAAKDGSLPSLLVPMDAVLAHLPYAEVPKRLLKPFQNGVPLPLSAFSELADTAQDTRVQLRVGGKTAAIAYVHNDTLKPATWLAE